MQENADCSENIKIGVNGMENYVDILNVTQSFHGRKVLDNVTVSFCEGKIHGVIGNNGSGKTVLFKAIPHNSSAALSMPFLPSASCRNLDLPPVNLRFLQSHLTKNAFAIAPTHLCGIALKQYVDF